MEAQDLLAPPYGTRGLLYLLQKRKRDQKTMPGFSLPEPGLEETHEASAHIPLTRPNHMALTKSKDPGEGRKDRCLIIKNYHLPQKLDLMETNRILHPYCTYWTYWNFVF